MTEHAEHEYLALPIKTSRSRIHRKFWTSGATLLAGVAVATASLAPFVHRMPGSAAFGGGTNGTGQMQASDSGAQPLSQRPATIVKPVACEKLPNVPGKSITTAIVTFPPNAYSPTHHHPGSVMAFVLKGTLRSQLQGSPVGTYSVGQTWFEP